MWGSLLSLFRSAPLPELKAINRKLADLTETVAKLERDSAAREVEFTEMANRMAKAAKRASGALGGRPPKADEDDEQLDVMGAEIDRAKRRQRILALNRRA